jgi:hypothetical protein
MRLVKAELRDVYQVHKTYMEFLTDTGRQCPAQEKVYSLWTERLTNPTYRYILLMHSKKVIGMTWGKELSGEIDKTFLIEGRYLRRAYRGRFRFTRTLHTAIAELTKDFACRLVLLAPTRSKLIGKYRTVGTLVEKL